MQSYVTNQRSSLKVINGALALSKTVSTVAIIGLTDAALNAHPDTEVFLVQVNSADVWVSMHGEAPSATTAINLVVGTILEMSKSQWLAAKWLRSGATDSQIVALQLRGT